MKHLENAVLVLFENYLKTHLDANNYFAVENIQVIAEEEGHAI